MKKVLIVLVAVLIIIQFFRPVKNLSDDRTYDITTKYHVPDSVSILLKAACNDCHSNRTEYPWYAEIQPIAWWLNNHVTGGKRHLNYSNFASRRVAIQNHKFEETIEMIEENEMPLSSYTWFGLHSGANLTEQQKQLLITWSKAQMDTLKAHYPADSLILRRN